MIKMMANARKFLNLETVHKEFSGGYGFRSQDPSTLSDWCLRDIGLTRWVRNFDVAKPFWMA